MNILLAYFSLNGHTARLAEEISEGLVSRGHRVTQEVINAPGLPGNKYALASKCFPGIPCLLFSTFLFRLKRFYQYEVPIEPPRYQDVSGFDRVVIGGPKWLHLSYPVARYLKEISGLTGKRVAGFATFAGPPFRHYTMWAYFFPFRELVRRRGGEVVAELGVSTGYQDYPIMMPMYRILSRIWLGRKVSDFYMDSEWAGQHVTKLYERIESEHRDTAGPDAW